MQLCHEATDLDPADLRLHHKVVVLGGGKQAHMRGGDIRRVVIHGAALQGRDVMDVFLRLANDHPAIGGRAVRIQAIYRGFIVRKRRDEELKKEREENGMDPDGEKKEKGEEKSEDSDSSEDEDDEEEESESSTEEQ